MINDNIKIIVKKKEIANLDDNVNKMISKLNINYQSISVSLYNLRIHIKQIESNLKKYEKDQNKCIAKLIKKIDCKTSIKIKKKRKLTGFAAKSNIVNELYLFLSNSNVNKCIKEIQGENSETFENLDSYDKISRTSVTKIINRYIKNKELKKNDNKQFFEPDELLKTILLPLEENDKNNGGYKHFNLQKYTKHLYF